MNVRVHDLMTESVMTTRPHLTVEHVRGVMERNRVGALPVVDEEGRPLGIVSSTDLVRERNPQSPIGSVMTEKVFSIPRYDDVSAAAHLMRKHGIHHLVVTHEQKVVGILSTFDLLELVEAKRFVARNPPTAAKRTKSG